jgi:hypothetical protein
MASATSQNHEQPPSAASLTARLVQDGFVIVPSILTADELSTLRGAAGHFTELAREGKWPHIRTIGKQFPPWPSTPGQEGIWGVQHLLHPDLPLTAEEKAAFTKLYFDERVLGPSRKLILGEAKAHSGAEWELKGESEVVDPENGPEGVEGDDEDQLVMELFNLLVRPFPTDFELRWHRDDIPATASAEEEEARLCHPTEPAWHAQFNLPLYDDDSLILIPGSHKRARTEAERRAGPYEDPLEGQIKVELRPGDIAFYDNNIVHRGAYSAKKERLTLHGSVGHAKGSAVRARNVLQHGVGAYVERCDFSVLDTATRRKAEAMRERLFKLGRDSGDVGYSLTG